MKFSRVPALCFLLAFFAIGPSSVLAQSSNFQPFTNNPTVAVVDGEPIMLDSLKNAQMHDLMYQLYEMESRALKEKILQLLSKKHPEFQEDNVPPVTEKDIVRFYQNTPGVKDLGSLDQMKAEIRQYLQTASRDTFIEKKFQYALKKKWAKVFLKPPSQFRVVAGIGSAMLFNGGSKKSRKVFLLEYSDFQCPFCKRVQQTLQTLRKIYDKDVQFGYRHFPLPFHKEAKNLSEAVECARDQGRFWQLQALFFEKNNDLSPPSGEGLVAVARKAGVKNLQVFKKCLKERKYQERVKNDIQEGIQLGIQGTPTFVLGLYDPENDTVSGEMFSGALTKDKFVEAIEKYLSLSRAEAKLVR